MADWITRYHLCRQLSGSEDVRVRNNRSELTRLCVRLNIDGEMQCLTI